MEHLVREWYGACTSRLGDYTMITLEALPVEEQKQRPEYSTCYECHRTFHAKSEDQLCLELCDSCFEDLRSLREPIISVHVKPRPRMEAR